VQVTAERINVGGQAVIEGVMMRSPRSFAVVCRRRDGSIVIKESEWRPVWSKIRPLRWPLLRGGVVLLESLVNGISALTFSADQQVEDAERDKQKGSTNAGTIGMVAISLAFGLALFVGVPHLAAWGLGSMMGFDTASVEFHAVDGVIKLIILVGYLAAISLLPDVRRVFQYHGAEHKSIYTYEQGLPLTVDNARKQTRFHPRCGTSFLLIVIMVSVVLFSALLQFRLAESSVVDNLLKIAIKIPLMFPIAGLSYELIKLAGKHWETSRLAKIGSAPGMWLQKITTREPDDAQLEVALISIRKTLWREQQGDAAAPIGDQVEVYESAEDVDLPLAA
jgi:uncharacterized protein YqhQ